jgi:hypothetical protein
MARFKGFRSFRGSAPSPNLVGIVLALVQMHRLDLVASDMLAFDLVDAAKRLTDHLDPSNAAQLAARSELAQQVAADNAHRREQLDLLEQLCELLMVPGADAGGRRAEREARAAQLFGTKGSST